MKLTELSWMWAEGRESSDLQPRPSPSGSESLRSAALVWDCNTGLCPPTSLGESPPFMQF